MQLSAAIEKDYTFSAISPLQTVKHTTEKYTALISLDHMLWHQAYHLHTVTY